MKPIQQIPKTTESLFSSNSWMEMKNETLLIQQVSAIDVTTGLFARLAQGPALILTPTESRRLFLKYIENEMKKDSLSDKAIADIYAMNLTIGTGRTTLDKLVKFVELKNQASAPSLKKRLGYGTINIEASAPLLLEYTEKKLLKQGRFRQAKAVLMYIGQFGKETLSKNLLNEVGELYKRVSKEEKVSMYKNGETTDAPWKKGVPTSPEIYMHKRKRENKEKDENH